MNITERSQQFYPYLAMLGIAALAFFQVVFDQHPMVYDMIDCYYPWHFHIGECFQNGIFPYWNPYQDLGYPIHADPSSGTWYPLVWLLGSSVGYTIYTIGFEFFVHIFFAGAGMFALVKTLKMEPRVAFIAAVTYMLCGIFVSNAQHLSYIVAAAWLPFLLNYYFKMIREHTWRNPIYAGFFLFLMITGGYPAFVIILFYFFIVSALFYLWRAAKMRGLFAFSDLIARHAVFVLTAVVLSCGILVSIWQVSPYLSRLEGFSLEQVLYSPFGPRAFISFIAPFSTVKFPEFFNSDISMVNGYFGIVMLLFFIAGIFSKKSFELKLLLGLALFSLAAAVGDALPVRELLYKYVPMMGVFRFPSVFRLFVLLPFILIGANYLNKFYTQGSVLSLRKWFIPLIGAIVFFAVLILSLRNETHLSLALFFKNVVLGDSKESFIEQHIAFQAILQLFILASLLVIIWLARRPRLQINLITLVVAIDLILATQLNAPYSVFYPQVTSKEAHQAVQELPKGFPAMADISIAQSGVIPSPGTPLWQNYHIFLKQITAEGFNSFSFGTYDNLESKFPFIFSEMQRNSIVLLSDRVIHEKRMFAANRDSTYKPDLLFFDGFSYNVLSNLRLKHNDADDAYIQTYSANRFELKTTISESQLLTLFQKYYDGWEATIDGEQTPIYKSNQNFMTIVVPEGTKSVEFTYRNRAVLIAFGISLLLCLMIMVYALQYALRD
jgi:hypothetical protein